MSDLPAPLVPPEVDLRDFQFYPLEVARLRDSKLAGVRDGEVFRANVLSWCAAWHQLPAGSLPDDDDELAWVLGYGRDIRTWRKLRASGGLRGWFKCADGRLYHEIVADKVMSAWESKQKQRQKTKAARGALEQKRLQSQSQSSVTDTPTESKGQGQGEVRDREGKGLKHSDADASVVGVEAADPLEIPGFLDRLTPYVTAYNALAERIKLPLVAKLTEARKRQLRARLREHGADAWARALAKLEANTWMHGDNDRAWRADFDFLLQAKSFTRLIEGGYDRNGQGADSAAPATTAEGASGANGPAPGFVPRIDPRALAEYGDGVGAEGLVPER